MFPSQKAAPEATPETPLVPEVCAPLALTDDVWVEVGRRRAAPRGMSLLEIMVVIVLIGLVTSMVGVAVMSRLEDGKMETARTQARNIEAAVKQYKLKFGKYPTPAQGLGVLSAPPKGSPLMERLPKDPWNKDYRYLQPGQKNPNGVDVVSDGPDGDPDTADDIGNWEDAIE